MYPAGAAPAASAFSHLPASVLHPRCSLASAILYCIQSHIPVLLNPEEIMSKYGAAAVRATQLHGEGALSIDDAWRRAANEIFPDSAETRRKSCPWVAYRGLCSAGLVRGVARTQAGDRAEDANATYAVTAAHLLAAEPELAAGGPVKLWRRVMEELGLNPSKRHNRQMDVVLALWTSGALKPADGA